MHVASQIILYLLSFAGAFLLGNFFDFAFWQAGFHAEDLLHGKPLPAISSFLIAYHHLPAHLALLPWLWLVGAPLLRSLDAQSYWEPRSFAFRYLAFLTAELFLFLVLLSALALPFISLYPVIQTPRQSFIEVGTRVVFWLVTATTVFLAIRRRVQR